MNTGINTMDKCTIGYPIIRTTSYEKKLNRNTFDPNLFGTSPPDNNFLNKLISRENSYFSPNKTTKTFSFEK